MKQNLRTFLLGTIALFSVYFYLLSAETFSPQTIIKDAPTIHIKKQEQQALNYLNQLRKGAGLIPIRSHPLLNKAAKSHANYLMHHNKIGHYQESNKSGFTGKFASTRIVHAGYKTPLVIENVSSNNQNYKESINGLMSAIYHRFAFLDFQTDEIGIGISQNKYDKFKTSFVYDMSARALEELYEGKDLTHIDQIQILPNDLTKALNRHKDNNAKTVLFPYADQRDVPPAFFDELPDPLPKHRVSGFPISISFSEAHFNNIKMLKFELYNQDGVQIENTLTYDYYSDINSRLKKFEFVLFPLRRLEWNSQYHVVYVALIDGKKVQKKWSFQTQKFDAPLHKIKNEEETFVLVKNEATIFYFPPKSEIDILHNVRYPDGFDIDFIDKNTIKLTALRLFSEDINLTIGRHSLNLVVEEP